MVEVGRIAAAMGRRGFVERILTVGERERVLSAGYVAGRWAVKEAVKKCLPGLTRWHDVEVVSGAGEALEVKVIGLGAGERMHVSLSHERGLAVAVAVLELL